MRNKIIDLIEIVAFVAVGLMLPLWTALCTIMLYIVIKFAILAVIDDVNDSDRELPTESKMAEQEKVRQALDSDEEILEGEIVED